ncbi:MAG: methyltransferase domain-containing protein [Candidatus Woesearchaeota archaeon]
MLIKKVIYKKEKKQFIEDLDREVTISKAKKYYIEDVNKDYHTEHGTINKEDLKKTKNKTNINNDNFYIIDASFIDTFKKLKKFAQTISIKDIGSIIAETGIGKDSVVIDAGTGSAALAIYLARFCKVVYSYDINEKHLEQAKQNIIFTETKNIIIKNENIETAKLPKSIADLVVLDLPEPFRAIKNVKKTLKLGGFIVTYSPCITQTMQTNKTLEKEGFFIIRNFENIQRDWIVKEKKVRPETKNNIHTAFLTIARKIEE